MRRAVIVDAAVSVGAAPWRAAALFAAAALVVVAALSAGTPLPRVWMLLLVAPLAEEAVFRAGLQELLLRRWQAPLAANLWTALIFGLAHALVRADASAFAVAVPALLIGWVYGRTRRLRDCVALHAAMNALWLMS
jgi:membrane protease YdiL (CAAX protease family)